MLLLKLLLLLFPDHCWWQNPRSHIRIIVGKLPVLSSHEHDWLEPWLLNLVVLPLLPLLLLRLGGILILLLLMLLLRLGGVLILLLLLLRLGGY